MNQLTTKKKPHTHKWIVVMEGGDEDMETYVTTQQDDESIITKNPVVCNQSLCN
jgi:hypothetical protein